MDDWVGENSCLQSSSAWRDWGQRNGHSGERRARPIPSFVGEKSGRGCEPIGPGSCSLGERRARPEI